MATQIEDARKREKKRKKERKRAYLIGPGSRMQDTVSRN